ncbi:MAG TPA: NfeD family protein [Thermoplasmata archaeon]|nr:NfeD family protein [Thermoplasmata archaeon]
MVDPANLAISAILIIVGSALFAFELIHPGAWLLIPASIMIVAGMLYLVLPSLLLNSLFGPAIVVIVALCAALATIPYYRWVAPTHEPLSTTVRSLQGQTGLVVAPVVPDSLSGKVKIQSEVWSARSEQPIPAGTRVRVISGEGVSVLVRPLDGSRPEN